MDGRVGGFRSLSLLLLTAAGTAIAFGVRSIAAFLLPIDANRLGVRLLPDIRPHGVEVGVAGEQAVDALVAVAERAHGQPRSVALVFLGDRPSVQAWAFLRLVPRRAEDAAVAADEAAATFAGPSSANGSTSRSEPPSLRWSLA